MAAAIKASLNNEIHNSPGASSSQISITIPDEPATDNEEAVLINFRLPNGTSGNVKIFFVFECFYFLFNCNTKSNSLKIYSGLQ